jgi:hypothetical protein
MIAAGREAASDFGVVIVVKRPDAIRRAGQGQGREPAGRLRDPSRAE